MKLQRVAGWAVAIQLCAAVAAFGQGAYKAQPIGAPPADIPAPLRSMLDNQGVRATDPQGATICEVWLRKVLPTTGSASSSSDVLYPLTEGAFLGVVHFPNATTDFRSQNIKAGYYTLRYGLIPQDGNHMGVNPTRDAFVMGPIAVDTDPNKVLKFDDLVKLSQQASGTPHPGFLVGAPVSGSTFPSVYKDDSGNWDLQLKGHSAGGDLPVAFTIVGHWQG